MDKHKQSRALRAQLRELYEDSIDAVKFGLPNDKIHAQIDLLKSQLNALEKSIGKNEEYDGLEEPDTSGYKISGKVIGICEYWKKRFSRVRNILIQQKKGLSVITTAVLAIEKSENP
ncbi:hypothetical protein [Paenibacillus sp.]|uniref:hypothetical protein n=1 Tax=Paenibacillus sp. TaxID=58172 RepID=UPI00283006CF|nr:hypothetical protein [Paenibacillus sp.]MDR0269597.1 hypothetical protein [Paenibacillus sp.]